MPKDILFWKARQFCRAFCFYTVIGEAADKKAMVSSFSGIADRPIPCSFLSGAFFRF